MDWKPKDQVLNWLLEDNQPSVRYQTLTGLLDYSEDRPDSKSSYNQIPTKGWAADILERQRPGGYWESEKSLYRPKYTATNWMALVLSDLGLTKDHPKIRKMCDLFFDRWLQEKSSDNIFHDEVCIVGNTARMLTRFGYVDDSRVARLIDRLLEDQKSDGGWHCWNNEKKGALDGWEALAAFAVLSKSRMTRKVQNSIERGAEFYLKRKLMNEGTSKYRPWFRFHYPIHYYYDITVGLDVLTKLGYSKDKRLEPALEILRKKRQADGTWLMEKIHPDPPSYAWGKHNLESKVKPFALEPEGRPSKWITLTALRILNRVYFSN